MILVAHSGNSPPKAAIIVCLIIASACLIFFIGRVIYALVWGDRNRRTVKSVLRYALFLSRSFQEPEKMIVIVNLKELQKQVGWIKWLRARGDNQDSENKGGG